MRSKFVIAPFIVSLIAAPAVFALVISYGSTASGDGVTMALFAATVVIELVALVQAFSARRLFSQEDSGYFTWTLIAAFLIVRLLAEARLATLNFQLVPKYSEGASAGLFFYIVALRYLYTLSDLLFIGALITTIRAYKSTGLRFEILTRDYIYIAALCVMPVLTYIFRDNLIYSNTAGTDGSIALYRLVAVTVGALIASLCLVVRRYALQMGGGAVARVWSTVAIAGIARDASFLALALMSNWWRPGASFVEQYLLWIFSCCWLIAALYQQEVLPQSVASKAVAVAAERG